jgi:NhaA family Na+:H+ antiporter
MSLFIAGQSFADPADYAAAKVSIFIASALAAGLGIAVLWRAGNPSVDSA